MNFDENMPIFIDAVLIIGIKHWNLIDKTAVTGIFLLPFATLTA
jgi:hypothetical protein